MRRSDPMLRKITKTHKQWLNGVYSSTYGGKVMSLEEFGVTYNRLSILRDMGLVEFKNSLYVLSERGKKALKIKS